LLYHVGHRSASESQHSVHVDIERLTPTLVAYLEESTRNSRAGGVHKNVDSPPTVTCFANSSSTAFWAANVRLDMNGFRAVRRSSRLEGFK
jgi:hypothetical protein